MWAQNKHLQECNTTLDTNAISNWAQQIAALRQTGHEVLLISSGAIAEGIQRLGWKQRPTQHCMSFRLQPQ